VVDVVYYLKLELHVNPGEDLVVDCFTINITIFDILNLE